MSRFYVERQYWQRWPKVLVMWRDNDDSTKTDRRYVPDRGTCQDESKWTRKFRCSECKVEFFLEDDYSEPTFWTRGSADVPRFCPGCGRRIEWEA